MPDRGKPADEDAHAACEAKPRPGDGSRAWLGLMIAVAFAAGSALVLGAVLWRWLTP